ncbi:Retrovirus-related Pol polyprotein from transposon TNT 1-94 [Gossypium australe]|uniref:Retrovirus-related Pol polyprotein from transposon TNT 1-94 n=1 Tax=Gossypium australe TaxID=47621 RepID=A0A5B6WIX4_9ROSI|nr:Retrovirus-related Pol polyprotein from transposon TNT 1-94 [Gossypium australe]
MNKICRHAINTILLNELFGAYCLYNEVKEIWCMIIKCTAKDAYNYKQQLKQKHKQLSLVDINTHVIIKDTNRKEAKVAKRKEITTLANLINGKPKRGMLKKHKPKTQNHGRNDNPSKTNVNLVEEDDIIAVIISQVNIVANMKE